MPGAGSQADVLDPARPHALTAHLRVLEPADAPALESLNARLSPRSRQLRYFTSSQQPGHWYVQRLLHEQKAHDTIVAVVDGEIVGVCSFSRLTSDPTKAEMAMLVDDAHQHEGLGALMLARLARAAADRGVLTLVAEVLLGNRAMHDLLTHSGFGVRVTGGSRGVHELEISLPTGPWSCDP